MITQLSIQNYINTNNGLKASEYLAKFSRLIRMIIEKASQSDILINDEIVRLNYYLELEKLIWNYKDYIIDGLKKTIQVLENNQKEIARENGLLPFELLALDPTRTICEKIMSLVRFSYTENVEEDLKKKIRLKIKDFKDFIL